MCQDKCIEWEITMNTIKAFLEKKNVKISLKRYGIDALGAMAQGLFASLLMGTILETLGRDRKSVV